MRYHEPDERDPFDPVIARALKQLMDRYPTPPRIKGEILRKAALLAPLDVSSENLSDFIFVNARHAGKLLYRLFAQDAVLASAPATVPAGSTSGRYLHMADHELIYSSAGGVGMLSLMS